MQTKISVFQFQANQNVRVEIQNGEPWFCLKDVTDILEIKNHNEIASRLKENGIAKIQLTDSLKRKQTATFINEPNLYRVIFRSNKAEAVKFQDWIFEDVIPQIRKTGSYTQKITSAQKQQIQAAVNARVRRTGQTHQAVYTIVHQLAQVSSYHDIAAADFDKVMDYCLHGEILDKEPTPPAYPRNLLPLLKYTEYVCQFLLTKEEVIRMIDKRLHARLIDQLKGAYCNCFSIAQEVGFKMQSHAYWENYPFAGSYEDSDRYYRLYHV